jgi:ABC-type polysaccharide/polyol phosphate export permease
MPEGVRELTRLVPLRYVVDLLQGVWFGESWAAHAANLAVLAGLLVVGAFMSARTFRWE